jgi:hypothetical protein
MPPFDPERARVDRRRMIILCVMAGITTSTVATHAYLKFTGQLSEEFLDPWGIGKMGRDFKK